MPSAKVDQFLGLEVGNIRNHPSEEHVATNKVIYIYQTKVADLYRNVTAVWSKNLINHYLNITVENPSDDKNHYTCKIDLKPWQFWGRKGLKSLEIDGKRVDIFWDFREAKFSSSPQPSSDYYVALVSDGEVVLLLGDIRSNAYKRTRARPSLIEPTLLCKKENVCGKKVFYTSAKLINDKKEHDIVIENSLSGPDFPEMWINIDGSTAIRIMNLNWKFRGNETVSVRNKPVQILWDVHDWLFSSSPGTGCGFFVFKPGILNKDSCTNGDNEQEGSSPVTDFCHFLYAWRAE